MSSWATVEFVATPEHKPRAHFDHRGKAWELPLTDFTVANELRRTGRVGAHSLDELGFGAPTRVMLLLSLGTEHNEWHSKLVAGVIRFP